MTSNSRRQPNVSIILPTYNRAHYLKEAIESVLTQTYQDWELLIIDDGSTDETRSVAQSYVERDSRISYHYHSNQGVSAARNVGIQLARGRYVAFLDDDDLWQPEKLAWQLEALAQHPETPWLFGDGQLIDDHGTVLRPVLPQRRSAFSTWVKDYQTANPNVSAGPFYSVMLTGNCLAVPTVLIERDCFTHVGLFNESYHVAEDYDMWLRMAQRYPVLLLRRSIVQIRVHDGAVSGGADVRSYNWHEATARVLEAQLTQVPCGQRANVRRTISTCSRLAGWHHLRQGEGHRARPLLLQSLHHRWNQPKVVAYLAASYWPAPVMGWLRHVTRRTSFIRT